MKKQEQDHLLLGANGNLDVIRWQRLDDAVSYALSYLDIFFNVQRSHYNGVSKAIFQRPLPDYGYSFCDVK